MTIDGKTRFYLRHWQLIGEWAALREDAVKEIEAAIWATVPQIRVEAVGADVDVVNTPREAYPCVLLGRAMWQERDLKVMLALKWHHDGLLDPYGYTWPYVGVRVSVGRGRSDVTARLHNELREQAAKLQWHETDSWPCWRWVQPRRDAIDPQEWADDCAGALIDGWKLLAEPLDRILAGGSPNPSLPPLRA